MFFFQEGKNIQRYRRHTFCPRAERTTTHNQSIDQYIDRSKVLVIMSSAFSISLGAPGRLNTTKLSSKTLTRERQFCISKKKRSASGAITPVFAKVGEQLPPSTMVERQLPTTTDGDIGIYGAIAPFKNGFDPLGLSKRKTFDDLKRYREAELTHGRVCMLAAVGILVGEYVEGSSFLFDASITGPAINHFQQVPPPFWYALPSSSSSEKRRECKKDGQIRSRLTYSLCETITFPVRLVLTRSVSVPMRAMSCISITN